MCVFVCRIHQMLNWRKRKEPFIPAVRLIFYRVNLFEKDAFQISFIYAYLFTVFQPRISPNFIIIIIIINIKIIMIMIENWNNAQIKLNLTQFLTKCRCSILQTTFSSRMLNFFFTYSTISFKGASFMKQPVNVCTTDWCDTISSQWGR